MNREEDELMLWGMRERGMFTVDIFSLPTQPLPETRITYNFGANAPSQQENS